MFPTADLYDIYGQTEAGPGISVLGPRDFLSRPDSVGRPMPGVRVAIVDEKGRELSAGSVGEITCQGRQCHAGLFSQRGCHARGAYARTPAYRRHGLYR